MTKRISDEVVERIGILSKLEINEKNREEIRQGLEEMIAYVDKLGEVDTSGIPAFSAHCEEENVFRKDDDVNPDMKEDILRNAPDVKNGMFAVPNSFDRDS